MRIQGSVGIAIERSRRGFRRCRSVLVIAGASLVQGPTRCQQDFAGHGDRGKGTSVARFRGGRDGARREGSREWGDGGEGREIRGISRPLFLRTAIHAVARSAASTAARKPPATGRRRTPQRATAAARRRPCCCPPAGRRRPDGADASGCRRPSPRAAPGSRRARSPRRPPPGRRPRRRTPRKTPRGSKSGGRSREDHAHRVVEEVQQHRRDQRARRQVDEVQDDPHRRRP